jgi:hypothetical protein
VRDGNVKLVTAGSRMGDQVCRGAALAMKRGKSVDFTGYGSITLPD